MKHNYAGIDWITATSTSNDVGAAWYQIFVSEVRKHGSMALVNQRWNNGWYAGLEFEGIRYGYSERLGYILIASSEKANELWPRLRKGKKRVTRLDLCCDIVLEEPGDLAGAAFKRVTSDPEQNKQRKYTIFRGSDGGATLYVGSRSSSQYGRLYDKGVESGLADQGYYWRFEVEFKKPISMAAVERLEDKTGDKLEQAIVSLITEWFGSRHVTEATLIDANETDKIVVMQRQTTVDRKLAWLQTQVSPTVRMLLEAGLGRQVALSLFQDKGDIIKMLKEARGVIFDQPELQAIIDLAIAPNQSK